MKIKTNIKQLITTLLNSMKERKKWVLALSCLVVFCTTYLLILPAFTLDKEEASEQGGVDVPGVEQSVDADETTEDLAKVISEDNEKEESAEASSEDVEKEEVTKPAAEKPAKASKKETSKSDAKKKSADITLENDESDDFSVAVESKDAVLSEDMSVAVREIDKSDKKQKKEYDSLYNDALEAVQKAQEDEGQEKPSDFAFAKFYDISLMDGDTEVEPDAAVDVKISFSKDLQKELKVADPEKVHIVHFAVDKETGEVTPEVLDTKSTDITVENKKVTEAAFTTDSFSVFAVVYTVDFHYDVDGKHYDFSMDGGSYISFAKLIDKLGISAKDTDAFIADIDSIEFSDSKLVWIGKADRDTTIGVLKKTNGLTPEYSASWTKEQIAKADAQKVKAGDWVLISLKPFTSEETMTVTLKDGEIFTIKVTDAQIEKTVIDAKGDAWEITATYGEDAQIPDGAELRVEEILPEEERYSEIQEIISTDLEEGKENIPSKPALLDISILYNGHEIEPAEGSEVKVEMKFVGNSLNGLFSSEDSPILVNKKPVDKAETKAEKNVQILHVTNDDSVDIMETTDTIEGKDMVSSFTTDSFSNWLIYLDENLETIEISEGDTITLREYSEWIWHKDEELDDYKNVKWRMRLNNNYVEPYDYNNIIDFTKYTRTTNEDEIHENYDIFHGEAKHIGEFYLYRVKNNQVVGKPILVKVTNNPSSPTPPVVTNTANLTVNLFDYNTDAQSPNPRYNLDVSGNVASSWDYHQGYYQDNNGNRYPNPPYEYSVNEGSALKFLGWGYRDSSQEPYKSYNNYSGRTAKQGIVQDTLDTDDNCPVLQNGDHLAYLFNTDANTEAVKAYPNVNGLFQLDDDGYYYYNSNSNYAYYDNESNRFKLYEHTYTQVTQKNGQNQPSSKPIGFFPFHEYDSANDLSPNHDRDLNHHFGMSMQVKFTLPDNKLNNNKHIIYEFSGDDDLWVYVDGQLVLDIGGIHQPVRGYIDFTDGNVYVYGINDSKPQVIQFVSKLATDTKHTLDMFYIERGGCDSNLSVKFNLPLVVGNAQFTKNGEVLNADGSVGSHPLPGAIFSLYDNMECTGTPLYTAESDAEGIVHFENVLLGTYYMKETTVPDGYSDNLRLYKVEVLEDITHIGAYNKVYAQTGEEQWKEITETTNEKEKTDITVSKAWINAGSSAWPTNIKSVKIGLYYSVNGEDPVELSGKKCTLDANNTSYKFEDLLTTDNKNNPITYSVKEESVILSDDTVTTPENAGFNVSINESSNGTFVVTNTIKPDLPLLKVDATDHDIKLSGAEFIIEKLNNNSAWIDVTSNTLIKKHDGTDAERSQDGYFIIPQDGVVLKGLDEGEYQIVEKVSPDGYIIADNPVLSFKVENGVIKCNNNTISEYEIENPPGTELPHTGGIGTTIIYIIGTMLVLGCGIYFIARKRIIN